MKSEKAVITVLCALLALSAAFALVSYSDSEGFSMSVTMFSQPLADSEKVNINTADIQQLSRLPGISETLAGRIIGYREENGGFSSIEQLLDVEGISYGRFNEIKFMITV